MALGSSYNLGIFKEITRDIPVWILVYISCITLTITSLILCVFKRTVWLEIGLISRDLGILLILWNRLAYYCFPLPITCSGKVYSPFCSYWRIMVRLKFIPHTICKSSCGCFLLSPLWKFWHIVWSLVGLVNQFGDYTMPGYLFIG